MSEDLLLIQPKPHDLGGFSVRRVLPAGGRQMVGPFIFFDHMGPVTFAPGEGIDVRPHPHVCLATVTYLFDGEIVHRDSLGCEQAIRPGDVNWMTAGRGIVHSERSGGPARAGEERVHGIQSWVALPDEHEESEPGFWHHPVASLPCIERGGVRMRLIAGSAYGKTAPVRTYSGIFYLDVEMQPGTAFDMPDDYSERALYVVEGEVEADGVRVPAASMAVFPPGSVKVRATPASRVMLLGGEPVGKRYIWWNFVASSRARIERAKDDWRRDRFGSVPGETEFIPLPDA